MNALLDDLISKLKEKYPDASPEQTAWDTLTRLEENIKAFESSRLLFEASSILRSNAEIIIILSSLQEMRF